MASDARAAAPGLVASYAFSEGGGTTSDDQSGKDHNAALTNVAPTTGRFGRGLSFNGTSSIVRVADAWDLDLSAGMTVEAWIRPEVSLTGSRTIVAKTRTGGGFPYGLELDSGRLAGYARLDGTHVRAGDGASLSTGAWSFVATTFDGSTLRTYRDGTLVAQTPADGTISRSWGPLEIGADSAWGEHFQGVIDNVRVYSRALSVTELAADRVADAEGDEAPTPTPSPSPSPSPTPTPTPTPTATATATPTPTPTDDCLASAECYPKPTNTGAGATGVPPGTTPVTECSSSPAPGSTLTGCLYTRGVTITTSGAGATLRRSEFRGQVTHQGTGTLTIEDSTFGPSSGCQNYDNSITGSNYTVRRSRFNTHVSEGPRDAGSNLLIEDNFIGPMCSSPGDHADGVQGYFGGTNVVVRHNTIDLRTAQDVTSPLFFADNSESADVQDNLVAGGGYSIRLHDDFSPDHGPWVLKGNRIVNGSWIFGPMNNAGTTFTASTCSDNRLVGIDASYNVSSVGTIVGC